MDSVTVYSLLFDEEAVMAPIPSSVERIMLASTMLWLTGVRSPGLWPFSYLEDGDGLKTFNYS